jgi:hypothetical protein
MYFGAQAGLFYADALTTVSPTYALEIQTAEHGMGLDGLLRARAADLTGIVNGIDGTVWSPATDPNLVAGYDAATLERKALNKRATPAAAVVITNATSTKRIGRTTQSGRAGRSPSPRLVPENCSTGNASTNDTVMSSARGSIENRSLDDLARRKPRPIPRKLAISTKFVKNLT